MERTPESIFRAPLKWYKAVTLDLQLNENLPRRMREVNDFILDLEDNI